MGKMKKFVISLSDYNRIHRVGHGAIRELSDAEKSCIFFSIFGSFILNKHYKIPSRPVAGLFSLCVSDKPTVASFGQMQDQLIKSNENGFHMWVQTEHHIIDFMAPLFPITFAPQLDGEVIPSKMFQRLRSTEAESPRGLSEVGDFITYPNIELTEMLVERFTSRATTTDLLQVADTWFGRRRGKLKNCLTIQDDLGEVIELTLPRTILSGSW